MEDIAMKEELLKKANEILEKTKNEQEKYEAERKIIYWLMEHVSDEDINMLEYMERLYEKISKIEKENEQYIQVKGYIKKLKNQHMRKNEENDENIYLFKIVDKNNNSYVFFTRENARNFIKEHQEIFEGEIEIQVDNNINVDLKELLKLIEE
jgi:hypothetical protein